MSTAYEIALRLHQAGRLPEAGACYQTALNAEPQHAEALHMFGVLKHQTGQHEQAVELLAAALRVRPVFPDAWNNLGLPLRKLGRLDEALAAFGAAVAQAPDFVLARTNLARLLLECCRFADALPQCQEAVRLTPLLPSSHNLLGEAYRSLRRYEEAKAAHRRAIDLAPDDVASWAALAEVCALDDDCAAAARCYERLIALAPGETHWLNRLGATLQEDGRLDEAAACYARALALNPADETAWLSQGGLQRVRGDLASAEACYRRARLENPGADAPLAELATLLRGSLPAADRVALLSRLQAPDLNPAARKALLFGLAQVLDAREAFAEAAACLREANALDREERRRQGLLPAPGEVDRYVADLMGVFFPDLFKELAGGGDPTRLPVFVFGLPRSGTSLVEQVLASHSRVHGAGEPPLIRRLLASAPPLVGSREQMRSLLYDLGQRYRETLELLARRDRPDAAPLRVVDKLPGNYFHLGFLALFFPNATFIHVQRDLRDVALSCWMTNFGNVPWASDIDCLTEHFGAYQRIMAHWRATLPVTLHEVAYERLVEDFEPQARRLVAACGLEWEPACLDFHNTRRAVATVSASQVRQPLYRQAVGRWKRYAPYLEDLFARLPVA